MTAEADLIRDRRRTFAAPGGFHDRLIAFLLKAFPAAIGLVVAVMVLSPLSPRGEIGFLLDRNKVAITGERIKVDKAMYRGQDGKGRLFRVEAGSAVQASPENPIVVLDDLRAFLQLQDGPGEIWAPQGTYNYRSEQILVDGPVNFKAADGFRMVTENVEIGLKTRLAVGTGGISGAVPTGTFRAQSIAVDLEKRTVTLEGNAHLRMTPGKLEFPK